MIEKPNSTNTNYLGNLKEFKSYLVQNRKRSETIKSYLTTAKTFLKLINKDPKNIKKEDLIKWKDYCTKYGNNSLTPRYGAIKKFMEYLIDNHILKEEFYGVVLRTLKAPNIQVDESNLDKLVLKKEEYERLFSLAKERAFRDYAIFKVAFWCQLRRCEVLGLNISDIQEKNLKLQLRAEITKGGKPATINISQECVDILKEYIAKHRVKPNPENQNALFIFDGRRLSKTKLFEMVKIYRVLTGYENLHFHMMRHSGITAYSRIEKDVKMVQKQARHDNPETTMRYINYASQEYENSYKNFANSLSNTPLKKPEMPDQNFKQETPKVIQDMTDKQLELKIKQLELELANRNAEIELLKLKERSKKTNESNFYG